MTNILEQRQAQRAWIQTLELKRDNVIEWLGVWGPLAAPLVPAGLTAIAIGSHYPSLLGIHPVGAWLIAVVAVVVIEILGIIGIDTWFDMRSFNETLQDGEDPAPANYAGWIVGVYTLIVVGLVFLLKIWPMLALFSLLPLTLLGVVTVWCIVLRRQHTDRKFNREVATDEAAKAADQSATIEALRAENNALNLQLNEAKELIKNVKNPQTSYSDDTQVAQSFHTHAGNLDTANAQRKAEVAQRRECVLRIVQGGSVGVADIIKQLPNEYDRIARRTIEVDLKALAKDNKVYNEARKWHPVIAIDVPEPILPNVNMNGTGNHDE